MGDLQCSPRELPEFRTDLIDYMATPRGRAAFDRFDQRPFHWGQMLGGSPICRADDLHRQEIGGLRESVLFHASEIMTDLAVTASLSMPEFALRGFDLITERGFIYFAKPIALYAGPNGQLPTPIVACRWDSLSGVAGRPYVWMSFYGDWRSWLLAEHAVARVSDETLANCLRNDHPLNFETFYGAPLGWRPADEPEIPPEFAPHQGELAALFRVLCSTWLLLGQPLTRTVEVQPDRAARRRMERAGHEPAAVRVIELRRAQSTSASAVSDREYHHQWVVRGHWRQQWFPAHEVHRPVWIAPHVKGPEGAPMLGGEKVYAWKR